MINVIIFLISYFRLMRWFSILLFILSVYIFFSYYFEWEHSKKAWKKDKPYSNFEKRAGIILSIAVLIFSVFLFLKSFY